MSVLRTPRPARAGGTDAAADHRPAGAKEETRSSAPIAGRGGRGRFWREAVLGRLGRLVGGRLTIVDGDTTRTFGPTGPCELTTTLHVHDRSFYRRLALEGSLGAAESFLDGDWTCDDLVGLIRIAARSGPATARFDRGAARFMAPLRCLGHFVRRNTLRGSRRNIEAHYDLGDDFFASFLDRSMTYSCGLFAGPETTLAEAQQAKYARLCAKLDLGADDRVVEIGTGWGGFALHAARRHGCRLTTTTISGRQYAHAERQLAAEGLGGQVELVDLDYRRLEGIYDKLVSIEMIEAVGHHYLPTFFGVCSRLLRPDGCMALQAITIPDQRYDGYRRRVDFIQRHIFPGGCLPSLGAISGALATSGDLRIVHLEDFAGQYARTLALWRARLTAARRALLAAGYSERLLRTWDYYFAYCEGGFRERQIGLAQIVLAKPEFHGRVAVPPLALPAA